MVEKDMDEIPCENKKAKGKLSKESICAFFILRKTTAVSLITTTSNLSVRTWLEVAYTL